MFEIQDLSLQFESPSLSSISVSLTMKKGKICAITGPSGVGKSSLLLAIAGFLAPQAGDLILKAAHLAKMHLGSVLLAAFFRQIIFLLIYQCVVIF